MEPNVCNVINSTSANLKQQSENYNNNNTVDHLCDPPITTETGDLIMELYGEIVAKHYDRKEKEEIAREKKQMENNEWIKVETKERKQKVVKETTAHVECNNAYKKLTETNNNVSPPQDDEDDDNDIPQANSITAGLEASTRQKKANKERIRAHRRRLIKQTIRLDNLFLDQQIDKAEDERTRMAKRDKSNIQKTAIDAAHSNNSHTKPGILQSISNFSLGISTEFGRIWKPLSQRRTVTFKLKNNRTRLYNPTVSATLDTGADVHCVAEGDRKLLGMPALRPSTKRVAVADGTVCRGKFETRLPIDGISDSAATADTFDNFKSTLISVGELANDGTVSVFTEDGVSVHKKEEVLILVKGKPILVGYRNSRGQYKVPLEYRKGQMAPIKPTRKRREKLEKANSVYDLPSTEEAIKWMHATCGYPVKSTWLKAIKAGNYIGWPLLNERNVKKYYPETVETPKGHLNQTRKGKRSTKEKPLEECDTTELQGKKKKDVYIKVYNVRETIFSDQTGKFPTRSKSGNKYIMVMVEIDSNAILVEPMKSRNDDEMIRAYDVLVTRLKRAGIIPRKHVLDNEVSKNMKEHIRKDWKLEVELVPPGCHIDVMQQR